MSDCIKKALLIDVRACIERTQRALEKHSVAWLEVSVGGLRLSGPAGKEARLALGELWRKEQLVRLEHGILHDMPENEIPYAAVTLIALDKCEPAKVPSFAEWLERLLKKT